MDASPYSPLLMQFLPYAAAEANPINVLLNYGVAGIGLVMFAMGRIYSGKTVDRLEARIVKQDLVIESMMDRLATIALPAMTTSLSETTDVLRSQVRSESQLAQELRSLIAEMREH